jgi:hypothetical protein
MTLRRAAYPKSNVTWYLIWYRCRVIIVIISGTNLGTLVPARVVVR